MKSLAQCLRPSRVKKSVSCDKETDEKRLLKEQEIAERDAARGFTDADLAEVMDNPEWTEEQLRAARPFAEVFPHMTAPARRARKADRS